MNEQIIGIVIAIVVIGVGFYIYKRRKDKKAKEGRLPPGNDYRSPR